MNELARELPRIMVVDDTPQNLSFLEPVLREQGYRVFALPSGERALQAALREPPHLILLDILMPGLDGYEVCRRLKADPVLREIPVIFLSALDEPLDKLRAFQAGGVDYITKPFQIEEVEARVRTHLQLRQRARDLQLTCERLRELERLRESLTQMIVHDLRSPLTAVAMSLDRMRASVGEDQPALRALLATAQRNTDQISGMVTQLLDISRMEAGEMPVQRTRVDLVGLVRSAGQAVAAQGGTRGLTLRGPESVSVDCDPELLLRVLGNLLVNAFKFTRDGSEIIVTVEPAGRFVRVAVTDQGCGIAPEHHARIFEKFGQVQTRERRLGAGLGLAFCKLVIEAHGGEIGVNSQPGVGSTFWFTLPGVAGPG